MRPKDRKKDMEEILMEILDNESFSNIQSCSELKDFGELPNSAFLAIRNSEFSWQKNQTYLIICHYDNYYKNSGFNASKFERLHYSVKKIGIPIINFFSLDDDSPFLKEKILIL